MAEEDIEDELLLHRMQCGNLRRRTALQSRSCNNIRQKAILWRLSGGEVMRFVTFQRHDYSEPGVLRGDEIVSLRGAGFDDVLSIVAGGSAALERVQTWL